MIKLITNLMKNTTPKKSSSSDPFWEKSESLFLQALFYYVWMEMPPGRKNIVSVLELLAEAKKEKDEPSRLDRRFELLARTSPLGEDHPAVRQYRKVMDGADNTVKSIIISVNARLAFLENESIKELLEGKFSCNEQPLLAPRTRVKPDNVLEPSPEGTVTKPDNLILVNPAVVYHPLKKKYYLYFKGNVYDPTWRGVHGVAIADAPEGPFIVQNDYVFEFETGDNRKLNAEDPFVWYHRKDNCFYAVFKDFTGGFTKGKPGLAIMYAEDGIHWKLPEYSLFMNKEIILKNGERIKVDRLERPQLLLDENDEPMVLYSACSVTPLNMKQDGSSFNIQIPILWNK